MVWSVIAPCSVFLRKKLGIGPLRLVLDGGLEIIIKAGVSLIGGHSVEDEEPK